MNRVVAIDTTTWWGGLALVERSAERAEVVAEVGLRVENTHTAHQLGLLERLLAETGWSKSSIDAYAASRGPGSFTGIRVGLATVRGLALGAGRPCFGIDSLVAMAEAFGPAEAPRLPLLDAGRGEVYGALYDPDASPPREQLAPWVGPPERALEAASGRLVLFGSGAEAHRERLARPGGAWRIGRAPTSIAAGVGRLTLWRLGAGAPDGEGLSPLYLRPSDAELNAPGS